MIVEEEGISLFERFEQRLWELMMQLLSSTQQYVASSPVIPVLEVILSTVGELLLLFQIQPQPQPGNPHPSFLSTTLSKLDVLNLVKSVTQDEGNYLDGCIFLIAMFGLLLSLTVAFVAGIMGNRFMLLFYVVLLRLQRIICAVVLPIIVAGWVCQSSCSDVVRLLSAMTLTTWLISMGVVAIYTCFSINPIAKLSPTPNINSQSEMAQLLGGILKAVIVCQCKIGSLTLIALIVIDGRRLLGVQHGSTTSVRILVRAVWRCILLIEGLLFVFDFVPFGETSFMVILCGGLTVVVCNVAAEFYAASCNKLFLPSCCQRLTDFELLQYIYKTSIGARNMQEELELLQREFQGTATIHKQDCLALRCYIRENFKELMSNFRESQAENSQSSLQQFNEIALHRNTYLLSVLQYRSHKNTYMRIAMYLHIYQMGLHTKLKALCKKKFPNIIHRFVAACLVRLCESHRDTTEEDEQSINNNERFLEVKVSALECLKQLVKHLRTFLTELKEPKLRLARLEEDGRNCYDSLEELKELFMRLQRFNRIDLLFLEFYFEFIFNILNQRKYAEDTVKYMKLRHSTKKYVKAFADVSLPAVRVDGHDRNNIAAVNQQTLSLLRMHKEELQKRGFIDLLIPVLPLDSSRELFDRALRQPLMCLIKTSANTPFVEVELAAWVGEANGKKQYYYSLNARWAKTLEAVMIVNKKTRSAEFYPQQLQLKWGGSFSLSKFYSTSLKSENPLDFRRQRFEVEEGIVLLDFCACISDSFDYVHLELIEVECPGQKSPPSQHCDEKLLPQSKPFEFHYRFHGDKTAIVGEAERTRSRLSQSQHSGRILMQNTAVRDHRNYAQFIRTYRLQGDRIYSIELAEPDPFEEKECKSTKETLADVGIRYGRKLRILSGVISAIIILFIALITTALVFDYKAIAERQEIYDRHSEIKNFEIRIYGSLCILRDAVNIAPPGWQQLILAEIDHIQNEQHKTRLFSQTFRQLQYRERTYDTYLDELCSVLISELYLISKSGDLTHAKELIARIQTQIAPLIELEEKTLEESIVQGVRADVIRALTGFIALACTYAAFIVLLFAQNYYRTKEKEIAIMPWRMIPDEQLQSLQDRLISYENLLELSERNDEVEVYEQMQDNNQYKTRQNPRRVISQHSARKEMLTLVVVLSVLFVVIFGYVPLRKSLSSESSALSIVFSMTDVYTELLRQSLPHADKSLFTNNPSDNLDTIEMYRPLSIFTAEFNKQLFAIFFDNSCANNVVPGAYCETKFANNSNPFLSGLLYYLNNLVFNLVDNLQSVFAPTGALAAPFRKIFLYINRRSSAETVASLASQQRFAIGYAVAQYLFGLVLVIIVLLRWKFNENQLVLDIKLLLMIEFGHTTANNNPTSDSRQEMKRKKDILDEETLPLLDM